MSKNFRPLLGFVLLLLFVGMACSLFSGGGNTPVQQPPSQEQQPPAQQPPTQQPVQVEPATDTPTTGGLTTFTDQNKLYQIDLPSDWIYQQTNGDNYYIDTFTSPDQKAIIENIVYDDGTAFVGNEKGKFALYLLNNFYSSTGETGDIRVSDDRMMEDGSERLTWTSKSGGYSGISFLETRGKTTFLLFTVDWANGAEDVYGDTLNNVIASYRIP